MLTYHISWKSIDLTFFVYHFKLDVILRPDPPEKTFKLSVRHFTTFVFPFHKLLIVLILTFVCLPINKWTVHIKIPFNDFSCGHV